MPNLTLKIAKSQTRKKATVKQVTSFLAASLFYTKIRDKSMEGYSTLPFGQIFDEKGNQIAYVSYNGKVFEGKETEYLALQGLLYDPYNPAVKVKVPK